MSTTTNVLLTTPLYLDETRVCPSCSDLFDGPVDEYNPAAEVCPRCTVQPATPGHWYMDYCFGTEEEAREQDWYGGTSYREEIPPQEGTDYVVLGNVDGGFFVVWIGDAGPYMVPFDVSAYFERFDRDECDDATPCPTCHSRWVKQPDGSGERAHADGCAFMAWLDTDPPF